MRKQKNRLILYDTINNFRMVRYQLFSQIFLNDDIEYRHNFFAEVLFALNRQPEHLLGRCSSDFDVEFRVFKTKVIDFFYQSLWFFK